MKLLELSDAYIEAFESYDLTDDGSLPIEDMDRLMEGIQEKFEVKAQHICQYIINLETEIRDMKTQERFIKEKMSEKIMKLENKSKSIKQYVLMNMNKINKKSITSPIIDVSIRKNPPKTIIEDEASIPSEYVKQRVETCIDKNLIKKDIQNGKLIPGVYLENSESLVIKSIL